MRKCFLCGKNGSTDRLECHHIFGGALRSKSDKYGLTVYLCGEKCHRLGENSVHKNADTMLKLKQYGQRKAMKENNWTINEFRQQFYKNYLDEME